MKQLTPIIQNIESGTTCKHCNKTNGTRSGKISTEKYFLKNRHIEIKGLDRVYQYSVNEIEYNCIFCKQKTTSKCSDDLLEVKFGLENFTNYDLI